MICLERYERLDTQTGVVEVEVRLPCGHGFGSACIVTWLKANNTCPACRRTLFPAAAPADYPYVEHGIAEGGEEAPAPAPAPTPMYQPPAAAESVDLLLNTDLGFVFRDPGFPRTVSTVAKSIFRSMRQHPRNNNNHAFQNPHDEHCVVSAVSVYMASYLLRRPLTYGAISRASGVTAARIRSAYVQWYVIRRELIEASILDDIVGEYVEGILAFLPPPDNGDRSIIDDEEVRRDLARSRQGLTLGMIMEEMKQLYRRFYSVFKSVSAIKIAMEIGKKRVLWQRLGILSPKLMAGLALYMSAHLMDLDVSSQRIAELVNVEVDTLLTAYTRIYPVRDQLIEPVMLSFIGVENLPRALQALPALTWASALKGDADLLAAMTAIGKKMAKCEEEARLIMIRVLELNSGVVFLLH